MTVATQRASPPLAHAHDANRTECTMPDPYGPLFQFLNTRFADRVVLRFGEIEDLIGFTLPTAARTKTDWWTEAESEVGIHRRAWMLARRTASPNLEARTVLFERAIERVSSRVFQPASRA